MKFLARITLLSHVCFLLTMVLRYVELSRHSTNTNADVLGYQPLTATLIIIGYSALPLGVILLISWTIYWLKKKEHSVPLSWLMVNLLMLIVEFGYFF